MNLTQDRKGGEDKPNNKTHPTDKQPKPTSRSTPQAKQEPPNTPPDHTEDSEKHRSSQDSEKHNKE